VHAKHQGKGLGRQMLTTLVDQARLLKYQSVIARISSDQPASLGLHHTLGFKEVGRIHAAGQKFGQQLDCVYLQLQLAEPKP
jgi:phosphinothricin acetyltransferase